MSYLVDMFCMRLFAYLNSFKQPGGQLRAVKSALRSNVVAVVYLTQCSARLNMLFDERYARYVMHVNRMRAHPTHCIAAYDVISQCLLLANNHTPILRSSSNGQGGLLKTTSTSNKRQLRRHATGTDQRATCNDFP